MVHSCDGMSSINNRKNERRSQLQSVWSHHGQCFGYSGKRLAADWATGDADDATTTRTCALAYTDGVR